jgi:hypothetical protein
MQSRPCTEEPEGQCEQLWPSKLPLRYSKAGAGNGPARSLANDGRSGEAQSQDSQEKSGNIGGDAGNQASDRGKFAYRDKYCCYA